MKPFDQQKFFVICFLTMVLILQSGCTAMVVGGAAASAAVALDRRTAGSIVEDENIELKFVHLYLQDESLYKQSQVNATSYNGWLLLTGETPNITMKGKVQQMASGITNVARIFNEVSIASPSSLASRSSDAYLTSKVKAHLYSDKQTKGYHVKVVTENSIVYLMGLLTPAEADRATDIVRKVGGVQRVIKLFEYQ